MVDVAIIGGGPAGSTCASILKKYAPSMDIVVLEREQFPRDHVGESQLPPIGIILEEMGVWDKVEAAGFPIKIGATYKWGRTKELWDFEFVPTSQFKNKPRPEKYEGIRRNTAFQVDRAVYDEILLNHAKELGAEVRQPCRVNNIEREGDTVTGLRLDNGELLTARYYVDATGHPGLLRRSMDIGVTVPTNLQNIAIWDYWQNAEWAVDIGIGATRVQVMSVSFGWLWFIPLSPTRTSIGLVMPASIYKESGKSPEQIYLEAIASEPNISQLTLAAHRENKLSTTKDWSFVADRLYGDNWFLAGESAGFADPILAAGLTLTHLGARELAITILELDRGKLDPNWLVAEYASRQQVRLRSHIRFADFWYTANSQFEDLKAFTAEIAKDNGLDLSPDKAWAWLAQGGFVDADANLGIAGFQMQELSELGAYLADFSAPSVLTTYSRFKLNLEGAEYRNRAAYVNGRILTGGGYHRGDKFLPLTSSLGLAVKLLQKCDTSSEIVQGLNDLIRMHVGKSPATDLEIGRIPVAIEAMAADGWIDCSLDATQPIRELPIQFGKILHWNQDNKVKL